eukprot:1160808-Pelagomonas_calceolata.AAC.36
MNIQCRKARPKLGGRADAMSALRLRCTRCMHWKWRCAGNDSEMRTTGCVPQDISHILQDVYHRTYHTYYRMCTTGHIAHTTGCVPQDISHIPQDVYHRKCKRAGNDAPPNFIASAAKQDLH